MAVNTWTGATDTDYGTAGNWNTTGETDRVPTDADDVIIANVSNDCVLDGSRSVKSFKVEAGGDFNGNAETLTVVGEADGTGATTAGFAVDIDGDIVGTNTMITITTPTTTSVDFNATAGNVRDLTINHASCVVNSENSCVLSRNLNVTLGEFKTNGNVLTVPGSISGNGTLTASTSTVTVTGQTTVATVNITTGTFNYYDDYRPTTSNITDNATFNQTSIGGQLGGRVIITASKTPTFNAVGRLHSSLDIQSGEQGNSTFNLDLSEDQTAPSRSIYFYNLELDSQGTENNTLTLADSMFVTNNLTITDGEISCNGRNLTVTGTTTLGPDSGSADQATLTCSSGTISLGSGKTDGLGLHVRQGGTFVGGSGTHTMGSLGVDNNAAAKYTNTSGTNTLNGHSNDSTRVIIGGANSTCTAAGTIEITYAGGGYNLQNGNAAMINHLTFNSNVTASLSADTSITGDLTITQGTLTTTGSNHALTVGKQISIASGATLNCNASTITNGSASSNASDFDPAGNLTLGSCTFKFFCGSSGNIYLSDATLASNTSTLELIGMQTFSGRDMGLSASSGNLHNLTVTKTGSVTSGFRLTHNTTLGGDLLIETGATLDTNTSNKSLTVTGAIDCVGNLTCNSSAVQCNGLRTTGGTVNLPDASGSFTVKGTEFSGYGIYDRAGSGNIVHNSGTVTWDTGGTSTMYALSTFNNITTTTSSTTLRWLSTLTLAGTLTVAANTTVKEHSSAGGNFTVAGEVSVSGTLGDSDAYSAYEFGSLTINSGGTYNATSGTTTITTGAATYSSEGSFAIVGGGTFTHNNGTLVLDSVGQRLPKGGTFYNVTLTGSQSTGGLYLYSSVLSPAGVMPDGTTGANYVSILGTLSITDDEFRPYNADKVYIHNLIIGDGTGSANEAKFDMSEADAFDGTVFVDNVTINSDGQFLFGDGDETSSTVGSSALNIYGAFRNLGGSVDIA